jgi:hypothetical protein
MSTNYQRASNKEWNVKQQEGGNGTKYFYKMLSNRVKHQAARNEAKTWNNKVQSEEELRNACKKHRRQHFYNHGFSWKELDNFESFPTAVIQNDGIFIPFPFATISHQLWIPQVAREHVSFVELPMAIYWNDGNTHPFFLNLCRLGFHNFLIVGKFDNSHSIQIWFFLSGLWVQSSIKIL